jgi:hypothetical protein
MVLSKNTILPLSTAVALLSPKPFYGIGWQATFRIDSFKIVPKLGL